MRVLSLFSGVGGLDLGIKLAEPSARVVGYVEKDDHCQRVLKARMADGWLDEAPVHGDITTFDARPYRGATDLICGGFPCQDISNAGKRAGIREGNRSGLWWEFVRVIREVAPRYVFVENVAALLGRGMDVVLGELSNLGFNAEWGLFSAAEVGAPHLRQRVFLLAYAQGARGPAFARSVAGGAAAPLRDTEAEGGLGGGAGGRERQPRGLFPTLADAECAERRQDALSRGDSSKGSDGEGQAAGGPGERCRAMADTESQRGELRSAAGERPGRSSGGDEPVGNPPVRHGLDLRGVRRDGGSQGSGHGADTGAAGVFPPGPADREAWERALQADPTLEPALRGVAARVPGRVDRLRSLGNAVVPLVAAHAFRTLAARIAP